jgi:hypothetical protein
MVMVALIAAGGLVVLLGLVDLTDYLLVGAGKRSVLHRRVIRNPRTHARNTLNPAAFKGARSAPCSWRRGS